DALTVGEAHLSNVKKDPAKSLTGLSVLSNTAIDQDWRLPHRGPLKMLLDRPQRPSAFPGVRAGRYWTASPQGQPRYAWFVDFDTGQTGYLSKQVRLMRNGRLEPALSDA
ncbi:MAG: DUF1566 domain-containing protein, partial [Synechococcaceae cyanobacterium SM1_2_3]|nr:DUF1566 domain-containing protein [Synechococcaceae cyanobacterium SM1_2_3]